MYSCGVGEDISFDLSLIRRHGVRVFAFDPTPRSIEWVKGRKLPLEFQFFGNGIADFDGEADFYPPEKPEDVSHSLVHGAGRVGRSVRVEVKKLESILKEKGHQRIDVLKLDIEGAEFAVLEDVIRSRIPVGQIVVEFHHRFPEIGWRRLPRIRRLLRAAGYRIFYASEDDRQYGFIWR